MQDSILYNVLNLQQTGIQTHFIKQKIPSPPVTSPQKQTKFSFSIQKHLPTQLNYNQYMQHLALLQWNMLQRQNSPANQKQKRKKKRQ